MRNPSSLVLFSATLCVYFTVQISSVAAKCKGPWANHMCFGGNGKRSWTAPLPEVDKRDDDVGRTLLRNVLLNRLDSYPPQGGYYSDSESFNPIGSDSTEEELPYNREQQLRQLIKEQILRREMAALVDDDDVYD
ncbi:uncharacterized protein LOC111102718 isoform X2 [Crassostrea virginica]|uniref:Uncharacterized protein LOC111102718 isoform X2 n=1 Tax=Crassostrea virginica TaxID=6565 RepID=A0A8B8AMT0_CRAVI|nr:uncharacterized protein LOC111102718 isoform X2 [Crassostrea virginica]XP_022291399.1 uncharacterized protein LOC111102813 isoform X2 [Crassostrea virginica]